jgi:histone H3/H4
MNNTLSINLVFDSEDLVFTILKWLRPNHLELLKRVDKNFLRTIKQHFVCDKLSLKYFCSSPQLLSWALTDGGCPPEVCWFVDHGRVLYTLDHLCAAAKQEYDITAGDVSFGKAFYFSDSDNELIVTEGHDNVYQLAHSADLKERGEADWLPGDDRGIYSGGHNLRGGSISSGGVAASLSELDALVLRCLSMQRMVPEDGNACIQYTWFNDEDTGRVFTSEAIGKMLTLRANALEEVEKEDVDEVAGANACVSRSLHYYKSAPWCCSGEEYRTTLSLPPTEEHLHPRDRLVHILDRYHEITKAECDKLLCRAGVFAGGDLMYNESRSLLHIFMGNVLRHAVVHTDHAGSKTVTVSDIQHGLESQKVIRRVLGYGTPNVQPSFFSCDINRVLRQMSPSSAPPDLPRCHLSAEALAVFNDFVADLLIRFLDKAVQLTRPVGNEEKEKEAMEPETGTFQVTLCEEDIIDNKEDEEVNLGSGIGAVSVVVTMIHPYGRHAVAHQSLDNTDIHRAVQLVLKGKLCQFALMEMKKASPPCSKSRPAGRSSEMTSDDFKLSNGLYFSVIGVAAMAARTHRGILLTPAAAMALTAVLEYLSAELIEIRGHV